MIKTLMNALKMDREPFFRLQGVQDSIPIRSVYENGLFRVGRNKYSVSYRFTDIDFESRSEEDKVSIYNRWCKVLNSLENGSTAKITIWNHPLNTEELQESVLSPLKNDGLDTYREDYNRILRLQIQAAHPFVQEKFFTVSTYQDSPQQASAYFDRLSVPMGKQWEDLGSSCTRQTLDDRLRCLYRFYHGSEKDFSFSIADAMEKGHSFKDFICPDMAAFHSDYFEIGDRYGRVLYLKEYASLLDDDTITKITQAGGSLMLSIDVLPVPNNEALKDIRSRLLGLETNMANWQRRQNERQNHSAALPYDYTHQKEDVQTVLDSILNQDQKLLFCVFTLVHLADTKEALDNDTRSIMAAAAEKACQLSVLKFQQMDGLNTALPIGVRKIDVLRTLTSGSLAGFIPFSSQNLCDPNGIFYGHNRLNGQMILADRTALLNGNSIILGVSGGGKSMIAKWEIISTMLNSDADILIIDPEREYSPLVKAFGGEIIDISATSKNHINPMDLHLDYDVDANPILLKAEFLLSLCEQQLGSGQLGASQKTIIDRCTTLVYRSYLQAGCQGTVPTLMDFHRVLSEQPEPEARDLALAVEWFIKGSLNTFAFPTNVDTSNRLISFDILDLGEQLMSLGMLVVLDAILNRIAHNKQQGKKTFVFIDEIYLLFKHPYSAQFLQKLWKRVRKYGAFATGITQNVSDFLESPTAQSMLSNSEFLIMLNQSAPDRAALASLLQLSDTQLSFISDVRAGQGLLKFRDSILPFSNRIPQKSPLYTLISTKPTASVPT